MYRLPFNGAKLAARQLLLFQEVLNDKVGQSFLALIELLSASEPNSPDYSQLMEAYGRLFRELAGQPHDPSPGPDWWQNHLLSRIVNDSNPFSRAAYLNKGQLEGVLMEAAAHDLALLQTLFALTGQVFSNALAGLKAETVGSSPLNWQSETFPTPADATPQLEMMTRLYQASEWSKFAPQLAQYFATNGTDELSRGRAFRWQRTAGGGFFETIKTVDVAHLESLVGYEKARAPLLQNTEQFLAGLPSNHVLLYGARGTGKSSTVKALLTRYGKQGLRLIEVHKNWLGDYPLIVQALRGRPEKFILFVDDLSFEADEIAYKDLKALLEGSLEARPANLLIYATSNRRHLVKEQFGDNGRPDDAEISAWDTVEEKLSLSDRFGLTITFSPPNQTQYLNIVRALAQEAGLEIAISELERRALQWEMRHSGFSGRVARQFIDHLSGEIQLQALRKEG